MREYGFSKSLYGYNKLIEIFELLDDKIKIGPNRELILPNNYEEIIGNRNIGLTKKFYTYKNNVFNCNKVFTELEYQNYLIQEKEALLKAQKEREERQKKEQAELDKLENYKKQFGDKWRSDEWIVKNIGKYATPSPFYSYYWSLIGDNYKKKGKNIFIPTDLYLKIISNNEFSLSGRSCLSRTIYGVNIYPDNTVIQEDIHYGVYGIFKDGELIYVGSTLRDFSTRFNEHKLNINMRSKELYVYSLLKETDNIEFKVMIDASELKTNSVLTRRDVEAMELGLIALYHPIGNVAGNKSVFKFREDK